jgi:hypothetical protein
MSRLLRGCSRITPLQVLLLLHLILRAAAVPAIMLASS